MRSKVEEKQDLDKIIKGQGMGRNRKKHLYEASVSLDTQNTHWREMRNLLLIQEWKTKTSGQLLKHRFPFMS